MEPSAAATDETMPAAAPAADAVDARTLLHAVMPHLLDTLRREPALALTLGYLLVALAGIYFNISYYAEFGIPILTMSQISDYLVAGLQRPVALLLALSTFPLVFLVDRLNARRRRRAAPKAAALLNAGHLGARDRLRLFWYLRPRWVAGFGYLVIVFFYGWLFVSKYAHYEAGVVRRGEGDRVQVVLNAGADALPPIAVDLRKPVTYLGAVTNYVFVYDAQNHRSAVLPVNNISRIEPVAASADPAPGQMVAPIP